jgi:hypothetical protein
MEGLAAAVVLIAILLGILLVVAFDLFCLVHLVARDDRVGFLSKLAWAVAIVCLSPLGGVVYLLMAARLTPYASRLGDGSRRRRRRLPALGRRCVSPVRRRGCHRLRRGHGTVGVGDSTGVLDPGAEPLDGRRNQWRVTVMDGSGGVSPTPVNPSGRAAIRTGATRLLADS